MRQEALKLKASLGYIGDLVFKQTDKQKMRKGRGGDVCDNIRNCVSVRT